MEHVDYYDQLGIPYHADQHLIRDAYRKLVRRCHPDVQPDDPEAEERFKALNEAYHVLSDPKKRTLYDQFGGSWCQHEVSMVNSMKTSATVADRARSVPPEDLRRNIVVSVRITLEEAFHGTIRSYHTGPNQLDVQIPPGVETGNRLYIPHGGGPGSAGTSPGDLLLDIVVLPHQYFVRRGHDLHTVLQVPSDLLVTGGVLMVPTMEKPLYCTLPPGTVNGDEFCISGAGMPQLYLPDRRGNLYVQIQVVPTRVGH